VKERQQLKKEIEALLFRAQPIRKYKQVEIKPSDKAPTKAFSPVLLTK